MFAVRGRGTVATGTLRGGPLASGDTLRLVPGDREIRVRELQVHGTALARVDGGGRVAVNLAGVAPDDLRRGHVLTADPDVRATDRILATFGRPVADRTRARFHAGTVATDAAVGRAGRDAIDLPDGTPAGIVRLAAPVALAPGERFVLRRGPTLEPVGGRVLDVAPPRGLSRRRQTAERIARLSEAVTADARAEARIELHGAAGAVLAGDVATGARNAGLDAVAAEAGLTTVRAAVARAVRSVATIRRDDAASAAAAIVDRLVDDGRLERDGDRVRRAGAPAPAAIDPGLTAAMDRLEAALDLLAPPPLAATARAVACPPAGIRTLERTGRIVVLEADLAYAMTTYRDLAARALAMAAREPLTPAAYRDATGTSRKYVMAILEDLDRRAILRRTAAGHVPGPKAPAR